MHTALLQHVSNINPDKNLIIVELFLLIIIILQVFVSLLCFSEGLPLFPYSLQALNRPTSSTY